MNNVALKVASVDPDIYPSFCTLWGERVRLTLISTLRFVQSWVKGTIDPDIYPSLCTLWGEKVRLTLISTLRFVQYCWVKGTIDPDI